MSEISGPLVVEEAQYLIEMKIARLFTFAAARKNSDRASEVPETARREDLQNAK
jgi:hypothetical protein